MIPMARVAVTFITILVLHESFAQVVEVPATANPWLAGMPDGTTARRGDSAPNESPALAGLPIEAGATYFLTATGSVSRGDPLPGFGPDGESNCVSHYLGSENGIADLTAPFESLVGVFLGATEPDSAKIPAPLDFSTADSRDYSILAPHLQQPFFIGDGVNSSGLTQRLIAPEGATRLFLGVIDEYSWFNNIGSFSVEIVQIPRLRITSQDAATILLTWPATSRTFVIQQSTDPTTPNWAPLSDSPDLVNSEYQVHLTNRASAMFYRLALSPLR